MAFPSCSSKQRLAIVQSVGYPNPNRSHFDSMAIWQTASLESRQGGSRLARSGDRPSPGAARRRSRAARPRCDAAAAVAFGRPSGDPFARPPRAVPPPPGRARRGWPRSAGRGPRRARPPGSRRAWLAAPVRRALLCHHLCQQCTARAATAEPDIGRHQAIPSSTAWHGACA